MGSKTVKTSPKPQPREGGTWKVMRGDVRRLIAEVLSGEERKLGIDQRKLCGTRCLPQMLTGDQEAPRVVLKVLGWEYAKTRTRILLQATV